MTPIENVSSVVGNDCFQLRYMWFSILYIHGIYINEYIYLCVCLCVCNMLYCVICLHYVFFLCMWWWLSLVHLWWDVLFRIEGRDIIILKRPQKYDNTFSYSWRLHCSSVRRCQFGFIVLVLVIHWFLLDFLNHRITKVTRCHVHLYFVIHF